MNTNTNTSKGMNTKANANADTDTRGGVGAVRGDGDGTGALTTAAGRLGALGRAELTLLARNRTALFTALFVPLAMMGSIKITLDGADLGDAGVTAAEAALAGGVGTVLLMVVYSNLVAAYTSRREELVLKRLRTGETADHEILAGTALPAAALALAQSVVLVAAAGVFLDVGGIHRPDLLVAGLLVAIVLLTALAATTSVITRTVESAQITTMPLFLVSLVGSGLFVPLDSLPDRVASVCELLPMTGVMTLVRAGLIGGVDGAGLLGAGIGAVAWTVLALYAVRKWFRWEPRR
ncbi:ABC transporter permease [Streptomyces liangshanensis]|uniref:Transport permease protein n=1 Tax=Streptomyces liangshanensis TaxID=2717324 RepID=A0A6G9H0H0_9ACTN|nr:ABC transporter permease [Streptomyces liangshanensis]QIQ03974.1 ABC transporter permease [Streptomyces liangshanensis]